jgi:hypothetical protein
MNRVVRAQPTTHGISKDRAQQPYRSGSSAAATADTRKPALLRFDACRGFPLGDGVHEPFDILARHRGHRTGAEQRLEVALDTASVDSEGTRLFRLSAPRQQPPGFGVLEVCVAEFGDCYCLAGFMLVTRRVTPRNNLTKQPPRFVACAIRCPGGACRPIVKRRCRPSRVRYIST